MGIKVRLSDGSAEVGGGFEAALGFVKALPGRQYDPATKAWVVPMSLADFLARCSLPAEYGGAAYRSGRMESGHQTRWGNRYSRTEWEAQREADVAEREVRAATQDAVDDAAEAARREVFEAAGLE